MFTDFHAPALLRHLIDTEPFADYCRQWHIPLNPERLGRNASRWSDAIAALPDDRQAQVELELARVSELSSRDAVDFLLAAAGDQGRPPFSVPSGPPTALWFFLHRPDLFHQVFLRHEIREATGWRTAQAAPGLPLTDLEKKTEALSAGLRTVFGLRQGTRGFTAADARRVDGAYCFAARVADRIRLIDGFSDSGDPLMARVRPALTVLYAYYPADGTVLLKSSLRSIDRLNDLLRCFGQTVLRSSIQCLRQTYDLNRLIAPFHPLPDGVDMELVRVKALHLQYPASNARRQVRLETVSADEPTAIDQLFRAHAGSVADATRVHVCHAELQVRLRIDGVSKNYSIRLWPDRCSLDHSSLGQRLRRCLQRWGLTYDE